ncbi:hypothetical protein BZG36_05092 [Bifiguratus adelaidae]|uniref:Enhancer of rudimentary homolog n=1 Tax=Bifiguratus adelaidae TaxID=1938954 RepID=A0A261XWB2_9FUNG|nr:hypothetical protein BZG36_05092 [Bifiguratus adelaidae]
MSSRTYYDFETVGLAIERKLQHYPDNTGYRNSLLTLNHPDIIKLYEQRLSQQNPQLRQLRYSADDLINFLDTYKEFVALVFEPNSKTYIPHDKNWLKEKIIANLRRSLGQTQSLAAPSRRGRH